MVRREKSERSEIRSPLFSLNSLISHPNRAALLVSQSMIPSRRSLGFGEIARNSEGCQWPRRHSNHLTQYPVAEKGCIKPHQDGGAKSSALSIGPAQQDPDLAKIIDAWPMLQEPIRAGIMAMIGAARIPILARPLAVLSFLRACGPQPPMSDSTNSQPQRALASGIGLQ
jgi:hypothetical protein